METYLSASRLKTLKDCSWKYWCQYHLPLPRSTNSGAIMGSVCHNVFEFLGNPRHKHHYQSILHNNTINTNKSIVRYVISFLRANGMEPSDWVVTGHGHQIQALEHIDNMILQGLNYDFFGKEDGADEVHHEIEFKISDNGYNIRGFIDKLFIFSEARKAVIRDFKSSKNLYVGEEVVDNIQSLMYQLAVDHLYPDILNCRTEFVFLQYDDGIINTPNVSEEELEGFKIYLARIQSILEKFTEDDAKMNFAVDKGWLDSNIYGFTGRLMCGRGESPTHKKKNGDPMWYCDCKLAYNYYILVNDKTGKVLDSQVYKKDLRKPKKGESIQKKFYGGCPKFQHLDYNLKMNKKYNQVDNS